MASGIENRTELYEILDKINANSDSYDQYANMKLFYNDMAKTAVIYRTLNEDDEVEVLAVFNPERILLAETEYFKGKILKSVTPVGSQVRSFDLGLGGFIDFDRLIRNICKALGVTLGKTFNETNPTIYNDLINICRKYIDNNSQGVYFMQKKNLSDPGEYYSYVPVLIVVDIAIYLQELGIFAGMLDKTLYNPSIYYQRIDIELPIGELYDRYETLQEALDNYNDLLTNDYSDLFNAFITVYENEIDPDNYLVFSLETNHLRCFEYPNTVSAKPIFQVSPYNITYNIINFEDFVVNRYDITYDTQTEEYTYSKTVNQYLADTNYTYSDSGSTANEFLIYYNPLSNLKFNKYLKQYRETIASIITVGSTATVYKMIDFYPELQNNTYYKLKTYPEVLKMRDFGIPYDIIKDINLGYNDILLRFYDNVNNANHILVLKDVDEVKFSTYAAVFGYAYNYSQPYTASRLATAQEWNYVSKIRSMTDRDSGITSGPINNVVITTNTPIDYIDYTYQSTSTELFINDSGTTDELLLNDLPHLGDFYYSFSNIGEIVEMIDEEDLTDITLDDGATYPSSVIDQPSFNATYPTWITRERVSTQPVLEDETIVEGETSSTYWISLDIDKPANQEQAQTGNLDNADIDSIIRDIDKAEEDDDSVDIENDIDDGDGTGGMTEDDITDVVNPGNSRFIFAEAYSHYRSDPQTPSEIEKLHEVLTNPSIVQSIKTIFTNNPLDGIISLIAMYDGLWNDSNLDTHIVPKIFGVELTGASGSRIGNFNLEKDLGEIDVTPYFENYTDLTDREISIYLPFVGEIPLNIKDLNDRKLYLKCRTECLTGTIIYTVYTPEVDESGEPIIRDGKPSLKLLLSASGNCTCEIPIKTDIKSSLMRNLFNGDLKVL